MKRRSFLTLLATLAAWVSMRPKVHADAINASFNTPKGHEWTFVPEGKVLCELWDNYGGGREGHPRRFIRSAYVPSPTARIIELPTLADRRPGVELTRFRLAALDQLSGDGQTIEMKAYYTYESGPKWWEPQREWAFIGHLPNGDVRCFQRKHAAWEHLAGYEFTMVRFVAGHRLTDAEQAIVISRIRSRDGIVGRISISGTPEPRVWKLANGSTIRFGAKP